MSNSEQLIANVVSRYQSYEDLLYRKICIDSFHARLQTAPFTTTYYKVKDHINFFPLFLSTRFFNSAIYFNSERSNNSIRINNFTPTQLVKCFLGEYSSKQEKETGIFVIKNFIAITDSKDSVFQNLNVVVKNNLLFYITMNTVEEELCFHLWCSFELQGYPKFKKTLEKYIIEPIILNFKNVKLTYLSSQDMFTNIFSTYVEAPLSLLSLQKFVKTDLINKTLITEESNLENYLN